MPFPRTWIEELVAESLQLEGFLVESGLPTITTDRGGRHEADIVGARINDGKLEIRHYEVSEWLAGGAEKMATDYASRKFSSKLCDYVEQRFCKKFGLQRADSYQKIVVSKQVPKGFSEKLTELIPNCRVLNLEDFIFGQAWNSMIQWKKENAAKSKSSPQLPYGLWLMKALEYLFEWKLLTRRQSNS